MSLSIPDKQETTYDIVWHTRPVLERMLNPQNVALIGATEAVGSVGRAIMENLKDATFRGTVYPVNPKRKTVLEVPAYAQIGMIPGKIDLAVICTPAITVPDITAECVAVGVPGAIIVSSGFKESGVEGAELEQRILKIARAGRMRIIGPNCLGAMVPPVGLNATFARPLARTGSVAFISQSGAMCAAVLDWSLSNDVGFSAFISIGSMLDVDWGDLIHYLGDDPNTSSIIIYMESIGDARSFLSAAREVSLTKPIIVLKVGRTPEAAQVASAHTGSVTGSDEVLDAAFRRVGVLRVHSISELFNVIHVLGKQPLPKGPRLAIVTNAGGPAVLSTDALILEGGRLAELSAESMRALDAQMPKLWSHGNPIDILSDADAKRYATAVEIAARDPGTDGVLVILTPQAVSHAAVIAQALTELKDLPQKPILTSFLGGEQMQAGVEILRKAHLPAFPYPDTAARAFAAMWKYSVNLRAIYETPALTMDASGSDIDRSYVSMTIESARNSGRTFLSELESKIVLAAYGIPVRRAQVADTEDDAVKISSSITGPVVLKLHSKNASLNSGVGERANLRTDREVRQAWQSISTAVLESGMVDDFLGVTVQPMILEGYALTLGSRTDPQFGPVLYFGANTQEDRTLGLPPLNATLARRMMEQTQVFASLQGARGGRPIDLARLDDLLVRFSYLVVEQPWIKEIEINPLQCGPDGLLALDVRITLQERSLDPKDLPKISIRPYPNQYISEATCSDGSVVLIRPIRPEDEPMIIEFHKELSESTVHQRYFSVLQYEERIAHDRLTRICFADYGIEIPLVAEGRDAAGTSHIRGVARLRMGHYSDQAQFAMIIADAYQGKGLGKLLLKRLIQVGQAEKLKRITATMLPQNTVMRRVCEQLGFQFTFDSAKNEWNAEILL